MGSAPLSRAQTESARPVACRVRVSISLWRAIAPDGRRTGHPTCRRDFRKWGRDSGNSPSAGHRCRRASRIPLHHPRPNDAARRVMNGLAVPAADPTLRIDKLGEPWGASSAEIAATCAFLESRGRTLVVTVRLGTGGHVLENHESSSFSAAPATTGTLPNSSERRDSFRLCRRPIGCGGTVHRRPSFWKNRIEILIYTTP